MNSASSQASYQELLVREIIPLSKDCSFAVLTLNRPKAMNSLNLQLATELLASLNEIKYQAGVVAVFLKGAGDKAFCAGGDIKEMYASATEVSGGACLRAENFFKTEYTLDYTIHTYSKPIVVWGHGVVMGGGLGLFQGCAFRVLESNARLAMPEVTIGLYPDVAACYTFNQFAAPWGRFFALSGAVMNATEAVDLGLADLQVNVDSLEGFFDELAEYVWTRDDHQVRNNIENILSTLKSQPLENKPLTRLNEVEDIVKAIFLNTSLADVESNAKKLLEKDKIYPWLEKGLQTMLSGSVLSLCCIDQALEVNKGKSLLDVFRFDMVYATNMIRNPEFSEGVRALLIDKDKKPQWQYNSVNDVPESLLQQMLKKPWEEHPLAELTN